MREQHTFHYGDLPDPSPLSTLSLTGENMNNNDFENYHFDDIIGDEQQQPLPQQQQQQQQYLPSHQYNQNNNYQQQQQQFQHQQQQQQIQQRSEPMAIPISSNPVILPSNVPSPQPSSHGSTGSYFLNNILNSAATFNNTQLSHTPPTNISTSYETSHFGKRARSGSVSERLRSATELEQKGIIDRQQKGILKDLIISGDNDLQHALDQYESGDATMLENMIQGGTLSNQAVNDIDLLGDLDLDFLTVNDDMAPTEQRPSPPPVAATAAAAPTTAAPLPANPNAYASHIVSNPVAMRPPPTLPTREQVHEMTHPNKSYGVTTTSYSNDDGIGELEFANEFSNDMGVQPQGRPQSPPTIFQQSRRSRSNSTFSTEFGVRARSNSLFSALLDEDLYGDSSVDAEFGRWMDRPEQQQQQQGIRIAKVHRRASAPTIQSGLSVLMEGYSEPKPIASSSNKGKASTKKAKNSTTDSSSTTTTTKKTKKEKKEPKTKKGEKKKRSSLKDEMKGSASQVAAATAEEERVEHVPGSGRPRSMSDPNIQTSVGADGLLHVDRPEGWIGAYSPQSRKVRLQRFHEKRNHRVWTKTVKYDVRKNFADSRLRVKGRFVKKEDELLMRELMSMT